ncbi:type VII secretion-associated serine protease mycosin [Salinispora arenicola]|uniref:Type VII secretion-associated serine protease mycosin n=1 Tax=Salinispora arenicola TaxID=168697 RepID=A0A542XHW8_SALAC|nr:type VII secretion-associated serine protease mycosin [Salinispora arenicola]TQL35434.1 type VII secretion-associated serine protease mycosin [Salinispora arenicola]
MTKLSAFAGLVALIPVAVAVPTGTPPAGQVRDHQWHLSYLDVDSAHRHSQGEGVVVAVPDTGVNPHPDLRRNLLPGIDLIERSPDGRQDTEGHGTKMAGLIAAHGRSDRSGALGIAPKAKILPIKAIYDEFDPAIVDEDNYLAMAVERAAASGAKVISISASGPFRFRLERAIKAAIAANVVVVAGVGNWPDDTRVTYPAKMEGVIAVGGVDRNGRVADISTRGPEVDIVAPCVDVYSTSFDSRYRGGTGTSNSTAIVAGAAALVRAKFPDLSAEEVAHRLTATAVDKGPPGHDEQYGHGVVDLVAALTADVPPLATPRSPTTDAPPVRSWVQPEAGGDLEADSASTTARGLATLGVLVAVGGAWIAIVKYRRRRDDEPPPRISR